VLTITSQPRRSITKAWLGFPFGYSGIVGCERLLVGRQVGGTECPQWRIGQPKGADPFGVQGSDLDMLRRAWRVLFISSDALLAPVSTGWQYEYSACASWMLLGS
jgi:hypothetical protein